MENCQLIESIKESDIAFYDGETETSAEHLELLRTNWNQVHLIIKSDLLPRCLQNRKNGRPIPGRKRKSAEKSGNNTECAYGTTERCRAVGGKSI